LVEPRIHPPPPLSTPRELPWREIEAVVDGLSNVASKLDTLISLYTGRPVAAPPSVTPVIIPGPPELSSINSRLDTIIAAVTGNMPTFATGQKDVPTAGEPEQLDDLPIPAGFKLTVIARPGNTGLIYLGKTKGECADNKRRFDGLEAGIAVSLRVKDASVVRVDAEVSGEGVSWIVEQPR